MNNTYKTSFEKARKRKRGDKKKNEVALKEFNNILVASLLEGETIRLGKDIVAVEITKRLDSRGIVNKRKSAPLSMMQYRYCVDFDMKQINNREARFILSKTFLARVREKVLLENKNYRYVD